MNSVPATTVTLSDEVALSVFRTMATIRAAEDRITRGLRAGELRMTFYPVRGQEAIPAAVSAHLRRDDYMVTTYRGMHDCIAKGVPLDELMAEMCGKVTGTSKGKGGPMHLSDPRSGLMVTTGVVGGGLPIAAGLALASRLRGTDQVTVVNFGDGATSIGATHEAANLAALWDLPVLFVCQHNQYGEHTRFADYTRTARLADRFAGLRDGRRHGRRQQRPRHVRRGRRGGGPGPPGGGADLPRVPDLPAGGARLRHLHRVRGPRRAGPGGGRRAGRSLPAAGCGTSGESVPTCWKESRRR